MTQKRYNEIPKRQKCVNKEEPYIGGAVDIVDDTLGKPQSQVNEETNQRVTTLEENVGTGGSVDERIAEEGAKHYLKSETYNKTELNNMITTPNQQYVTLIAESGDTLSDIFDGVTGAADTTYRVGNWDGSANSGAGGYDVTVYSEYSYDGTNFVHLSTKTQIGEVFDISAYHATGGTLATYADLSAALDSNNGGGVPQSLQKGGMRIQYVSSIDNKYMQYRYMSSSTAVADFTNVANWQGVQNKLVVDSENLVTGRTVFDELYEPKIDGDDSSVSFEQTARFKLNIALNLVANKSYRLEFSVTGLSNTDIDNLSMLRTSNSTNANIYVTTNYFTSEQKTELKATAKCYFDLNTEIATSYLHLYFNQNYTPTSGNSITITRYIYSEKYANKDVVTEIKTFLNQGYIFKGFAIPSTTPPTENIGRIFYIAQSGTFANFNNIVVNNGCLGVLYYDTEWHVSNIVAQNSIINVNDINNHPTDYSSITNARNAVPSNLRHTGLIFVSYAYTDEGNKWFVQLNIDSSNWSNDASWIDLLYTNDESAIQGSKNPITSGGVWNELYEIESIEGDSASDTWTSRYKIIELDVDAGKDMILTMEVSGLAETDIDNITEQYPIKIYDGPAYNSPQVWSGPFASSTIKPSLKETGKCSIEIPALETAGNHISLWFNNNYTPTSGNSISFSIEYKIKKTKYALRENTYSKEEVYSKEGVKNYLINQIKPVNIWGDILPPMFKSKLMAYDKDLLIVCQGDSLTGKINTADANPNAAISCPGGGYNSWVKLLQDIVNKDKIDWRRLDASIDSEDFFTKVGTWVWTPYSVLDDGMNNRYLESSSAADTFRSASASASVVFAFDGSKYDKCNIIFSKSLNATANAAIAIAEGNGKMLVSLDRETWVEANGFTHSQFTTSADQNHDFGVARQERHRRLWMKKATTFTDTLHITYSATNTNDSYFYCWGVEMYKGIAVLFDNIGRGGRTSFLLSYNISDVFDRKPDLLIYEMPFANEQSEAMINAQGNYDYWTYPYFVSENGDTGSGRGGTAVSYRVQSAGYTTLPIIFLLPHIRSGNWEGNNSIIPSNRPNLEAPMYNIYVQWFGLLRSALVSFTQVKFVNMLDQVYGEAIGAGMDYQTALSAGYFTADGIHLNQTLSNIYAKYLSGIFNV